MKARLRLSRKYWNGYQTNANLIGLREPCLRQKIHAMIQAYPQLSTVKPGDTLVLNVSTDSLSFRVDIYRQGATLDFKKSYGWMKGVDLPQGNPYTDWGWIGYPLVIPNDWPSGVYIAMLFEGDANNNEISAPNVSTPDGRSAKALFVVKSSVPGSTGCMLYKLPLFTYHAYNNEGGACLYTGVQKVSMRRPGGGTGGNPWDAFIPDFYDNSSPRQAFAHWDAYFISWLESNQYRVEYCTDLDVHANENGFISNYRLILSVGHDEYWSPEMRSNIEQFISNGGNVAFFSGNTCWWRIHLEDGDTAFSCDRSGNPTDDQWYRYFPENSLTGVSYRNAGGRWTGQRENVGYAIQNSTHWIFQGTGVKDGDVIGANSNLVGYECDGARFDVLQTGYKVPTGTDGTPLNFLILGTGSLTPYLWEDFSGGNYTATMGIYCRSGIVFTGATVDWARVLKVANDPIVQRITKNVLDHLCSFSLNIIGPTNGICSNNFVEGQKIKFHVDISKLPNQNALQFSWTVKNAQANVLNQPYCEVLLPSPPQLVTITVKVTDNAGCDAFGTLSFMPHTHRFATFRLLICKLILMERHKKALVGVGEGNEYFVDPLFDPIPFERFVLNPRERINDILKTAKDLQKISEQLLKGDHKS